MNQHLSPQQIDEYVIGQRTCELEGHLRVCRICADEVQHVAAQLELFGSAVRSWGDAVTSDVASAPVIRRSGVWRVLLTAAALLLMIAVPCYRREAMKQQAARDEILLQQVEAGISRSVPAPMEPLAKLMANDESERSQ